jgi:hypothetical protein
MPAKNYGNNANYQRQEHHYREKALKLFPWICGRCAREFIYSNLRELTVHHIDHDHNNNPDDGSNWELLCLYCHDNEHARYTEYDLYGSKEKPGEQDRELATNKPFADLKKLLNKK